MTGTRLSVFPLPGALLFPGAHLPLHIFEPRYTAMVSDAMARDRRSGMIQPPPGTLRGEGGPGLFYLGCSSEERGPGPEGVSKFHRAGSPPQLKNKNITV